MFGYHAGHYPFHAYHRPQEFPMCHAEEADDEPVALDDVRVRFNTSDERSAPRPSALPTERYDPLGVLKAVQELPRFRGFDFANLPPKPHQIAPGLLSDGTLTVRYPPLERFLDNQTPSADAAVLNDERVFALAALATFYRPRHPAHLIFWGKKVKQETAERVHKIWTAKPSRISSPAGWSGVSENLWALENLQANAGVIQAQAEETRRSLRKRKPAVPAQPIDLGESNDESLDRDEIAEPLRKRPRLSRATKAKAAAAKEASTSAKARSPAADVHASGADQDAAGTDSTLTTPASTTTELPPTPRPTHARSCSAASELTASTTRSGSATAVSESSSELTSVALDMHSKGSPSLSVHEVLPSKRSARPRKPVSRADAAPEADVLGLTGAMAPSKGPRAKAPATRRAGPRAAADPVAKAGAAKPKRAPARPRAKKATPASAEAIGLAN